MSLVPQQSAPSLSSPVDLKLKYQGVMTCLIFGGSTVGGSTVQESVMECFKLAPNSSLNISHWMGVYSDRRIGFKSLAQNVVVPTYSDNICTVGYGVTDPKADIKANKEKISSVQVNHDPTVNQLREIAAMEGTRNNHEQGSVAANIML